MVINQRVVSRGRGADGKMWRSIDDELDLLARRRSLIKRGRDARTV